MSHVDIHDRQNDMEDADDDDTTLDQPENPGDLPTAPLQSDDDEASHVQLESPSNLPTAPPQGDAPP